MYAGSIRLGDVAVHGQRLRRSIAALLSAVALGAGFCGCGGSPKPTTFAVNKGIDDPDLGCRLTILTEVRHLPVPKDDGGVETIALQISIINRPDRYYGIRPGSFSLIVDGKRADVAIYLDEYSSLASILSAHGLTPMLPENTVRTSTPQTGWVAFTTRQKTDAKLVFQYARGELHYTPLDGAPPSPPLTATLRLPG